MTSLSKNVKFSIEKENPEGSFVVRSKTESFNLDHIVDKDIVSFYGELSKYGIVDTGILPLSGTGILAIRSAGNHTQVTFQHAPQINYINWGEYEGDPHAKVYLVAQPYRIWIGDILDGNMYGARMFYSPYPITSATQPLYHLNLPNTNCKGYRNNGVGWQCLYHNEDWSKLPFNEKVVRFAERCSGVEAFNDKNMSETDGPGFYREHYNNVKDHSYLWNPISWQKKTQEEGIDWVLNESIWIPVLVVGLDDQRSHKIDGVPLTLGMAMVGNYRAYYTDDLVPKPINALTRSDLSGAITSETVASWIMRSHNASKIAYVSRSSIDESAKHREDILLNSPQKAAISNEDEEQDEDEDEEQNIVNIVCPVTGDMCHVDQDNTMTDSLDNVHCTPCFEANTVYCENTDSYLPADSEYVHYDEQSGNHFNVKGFNYGSCDRCGVLQLISTQLDLSQVLIMDQNENIICCVDCINDYLKDTHLGDFGSCNKCSCKVPLSANGEILSEFSDYFCKSKNIYLDGNDVVLVQDDLYCVSCYNTSIQCPTGHRTWLPLGKLPSVVAQHGYDFPDIDSFGSKKVFITHMCASCSNPDIWQAGLSDDQIHNLSTYFSVITRAEDRFRYAYENGFISDSAYLIHVTHKEME